MMEKIDKLLQQDGYAAKAAGFLVVLIGSLLTAGLIPEQHVESAAAVMAMLTAFAPAAYRRDIATKKAMGAGDEVA